MFKQFYTTLLLLTLSLTFLSSCQKVKDLEFKEYKNLKFDNLNFKSADMKVDLVYFNPNNFGLELARTDLDIFLDDNLLGHSTQNLQVNIPRKANFTIPLLVNVDIKNLIKNGVVGFTSYMDKDVKIKFLGNIKLGKAGIYKNFKVDYTTTQNFSKLK
jgi:hypothetical protein